MVKLFFWTIFLIIFFLCVNLKFGYIQNYFPDMGFWEYFWIGDKIRLVPGVS